VARADRQLHDPARPVSHFFVERIEEFSTSASRCCALRAPGRGYGCLPRVRLLRVPSTVVVFTASKLIFDGLLQPMVIYVLPGEMCVLLFFYSLSVVHRESN
jgi:hypothetical protein